MILKKEEEDLYENIYERIIQHIKLLLPQKNVRTVLYEILFVPFIFI